MGSEEILTFAAELSAAFEAGDVDRIGELYGDDVVVWHNYDGLARSRAQCLESAAWVAATMRDFRIDDRRVDVLPDGYVQQCTFRAVDVATGRRIEIPAMLRVWCADGRATRIDEYSDSSHGALPQPAPVESNQ